MSRLKRILIVFFLVLFLVLLLFFFVGTPPQVEEIKWGVNFSPKHAQFLGLDWKENYSALLDDLKVKRIKLITHWDQLEPEKDKYFFEDLDWQIEKAEEKGVKFLLVIGMKTPRWPECHIPGWAVNLAKEDQQKEILELLEEIVLRYRDSSSIWSWQVENEPFFPFGTCPWSDRKFLEEEVALVKSLDEKKRPVLISVSGEWSPWVRAAKIGDIVGTTMYKKVWWGVMKTYLTYPLPEIFYWRKAKVIEKLFGKKVIVVELQAEPWGPKLLYESPIEEQEKTMNPERFKKMINFAKKTGFDEFYLWGAEWWFWLKETRNDSRIWNEARELF